MLDLESLSTKFKIALGGTKHLLKRYAGRHLPQSSVQRPKKGFQSPTASWFQDSRKLRDRLLATSSKFAPLYDLHEVERVIATHEAGRNGEQQLSMLLSCAH